MPLLKWYILCNNNVERIDGSTKVLYEDYQLLMIYLVQKSKILYKVIVGKYHNVNSKVSKYLKANLIFKDYKERLNWNI